MAAVWRLARVAVADLEAILSTNLERWGELGRARYASLLYAAFEQIAARPEGPLTQAVDEVQPGLRRLHLRRVLAAKGVKAPVHVVYYRSAPTGVIEVVRVLHERVEPTLHFVT
jgi:toxin ParE1/3/4